MTAYILGTLSGVVVIALLQLPRHMGRRPAAAFSTPEPGTRWLVCDTTTCAHITTRHVPQPGGAYRCTSCHTVKEGRDDA